MKPRHLYIHVPFCARRCGYCDFAFEVRRRPPVAAWLDAVEAELSLWMARPRWAAPLELDTIYLGGGTPSLLGPGAMPELRRRLERYVCWEDERLEWTGEANPESFAEALARDWQAAGVNRLSLGVQSFHEPALRWMGRLHGAAGPARAMAAARAAGIRSVNIDLIFGLPPRLGRSWAEDLELALELDPEHVSLYGLTAEAGTPLGRRVAERREQMPGDERYAEEYLLAAERLTAAGFEHYEVSNFARPGRQSGHNRAYWEGAPYLGLGASAHSYLPPVRQWNVRDWNAYAAAVQAGALPVGGSERVVGSAARIERSWLQLRTAEGVRLDDCDAAQQELTAQWVRGGWAELGGGRVRLNAQGWLLLDRLAVELEAASLDDAELPATSLVGSGDSRHQRV
ncbi:MAG: radical SAM family heme chaperone HemW [Gemmatimonadetes bacterium]|nr:radical SAM family heme chaperone HemW [Gemmatimonadota bacterium]